MLLIGSADKSQQFLDNAPQRFLLIDDGPIADIFLNEFPNAKLFDVSKHSFNPLKNLDYKGARDFASLVYSLSPQGENTLTVRNGRRALLKLLLTKPARLDRLPDPSGDAELEATGMIDELLLSPALRSVLCNPTNFPFKGVVIARLNPAELGDFDCLVLANLLIGQFKGHVIVPDGGFYLRDFHTSLIRQGRLTVGLISLSEVSRTLQQAVLAIKDRHAVGCLFDDAETLAKYEGLSRDTNGYSDFIRDAMQRT